VCRASLNCAGGPAGDLGVAVDGAGCCLGNPNAMAYTPPGSEDCIACVGGFYCYSMPYSFNLVNDEITSII
jgi:hypothetical protein